MRFRSAGGRKVASSNLAAPNFLVNRLAVAAARCDEQVVGWAGPARGVGSNHLPSPGSPVREEDQWRHRRCPRRCSRLIRGPHKSTAMRSFAASASAVPVKHRVPPAPTPAWRRKRSSISASASGSAWIAPTSAMPPAAFSRGRRSTPQQLPGPRCPRAGSCAPRARRSASGMPSITSTAVSALRSAGAVRRPARRCWTRSPDG